MLDWTCYTVILVAEYYFFLMYEETEKVVGKISPDLHYTAYTDYMAVARLTQAAQGMGEYQVSLDSALWWATVPGPGWPPSASAGARVSEPAYMRASYICKSVFAGAWVLSCVCGWAARVPGCLQAFQRLRRILRLRLSFTTLFYCLPPSVVPH